MARALLAAALAAALLAPASAEAKVIRSGHYHVAYFTDRLSSAIGFIPVAGISPGRKPVDIRVGRNTYRGVWKSFTVSRHSTSEALKHMLRDSRGRYGEYLAGLFADRALTARDKRNFQVIADIARDADVLAVAKGHPACGSGLTIIQARAIAARRITSWSQAGVASGGSIRLGHTDDGSVYERRFGTTRRPAGARRGTDAGLTAAANGDRSVAVVTRWSLLRQFTGLCAVPINGVVPSDVSVHSLRYAGAYAMTYVVNRKRLRSAYDRAKRKAFVNFLLSDAAAKLWKRNGLLMADEPPAAPSPSPTASPAPADGAPPPATDGQGRPISATRDDEGVRAALAGERFQFSHDAATERYAFESGGLLRMLTISNDGQCSQLEGTWTLIEGWRHPEYGGGTTARVHISAPGTSGHVTIDMPGDAPGTAYWNGQPHTRSRDLPGSC